MELDSKFFYGRKVTNVNTISEAHDIISNSENVSNVVVLPPDSGDKEIESDLEDILHDEEEEFEPAGQLEVEENITAEEEAGEIPSVHNPRWRKHTNFDKNIPTSDLELPEELERLEGASPFKIWKEIFSKSIIEMIIKETNLYANRDKNNQGFSVNISDISKFIGIIMLSGYNSFPNAEDFWSTDEDLGCPLVKSTMSRNRFRDIKRYIHFCDNHNLEEGNKFAKVAPLYKELNKNLIKFKVFHAALSIDEAMVPYYGRHGSKMYIKGKPIRFGYKIWVLCSSDGYPYCLILYQGKSAAVQGPLSSHIVLSMVKIIETYSSPTKHHIYFDNFFTSYDLMHRLYKKNIRATATIRENRSAKANECVMNSKTMKKKGRGTFDYTSDGKVFFAKWHDNAIVNVCSNWETHLPIKKVKRRTKGATKEVEQPNLINSYNKGMGGVDLCDRLCSSYRPEIRGKKWYWPLFTHAINISVVAAWRIHCKVSGNIMTHLEFRRYITRCLLKMEASTSSSSDRLPRAESTNLSQRQPSSLPPEVRFDRTNHNKEPTTQGRCKVCHKNARLQCSKCKVRLHGDHGKTCFEDYHKEI